ncbi:hypothetical protein E2C01_070675 [Portunus trituberculatus]|uniref:Uncharacterized protein n=1 Tax=Portunus trituberculatus TaxID=210409 RepID=A0A5B7I5W9_PORTR|nr:hypothetical protein [Portunus trituberculatus]
MLVLRREADINPVSYWARSAAALAGAMNVTGRCRSGHFFTVGHQTPQDSSRWEHNNHRCLAS